MTTPDQIIEAVCQHFGVTREELLGPRRHKRLMPARKTAANVMHCRMSLGPSEIARIFNRHHTSAIHWLRCGAPWSDAADVEKLLDTATTSVPK